ncbi:MAG: type 4a pilus biogenesis protein PilO [Gammaproteobacteria bacterium]
MDIQDAVQRARNLDPKNMGNWPVAAKAGVLGLLSIAVLGAGFWFDTKQQLETVESVRAQEPQLIATFERKQSQAASLGPLKAQLEEMKESFGTLLRLLPNKTEVEGLVDDISQAGRGAGLEFDTLSLAANEEKGEYIATLRINMQVTGSYHQLGEFISLVAALPRIVTQHQINIQLQGEANEEGSVPLRMSTVARTYRYLEEDELESDAQ